MPVAELLPRLRVSGGGDDESEDEAQQQPNVGDGPDGDDGPGRRVEQRRLFAEQLFRSLEEDGVADVLDGAAVFPPLGRVRREAPGTIPDSHDRRFGVATVVRRRRRRTLSECVSRLGVWVVKK